MNNVFIFDQVIKAKLISSVHNILYINLITNLGIESIKFKLLILICHQLILEIIACILLKKIVYSCE